MAKEVSEITRAVELEERKRKEGREKRNEGRREAEANIPKRDRSARGRAQRKLRVETEQLLTCRPQRERRRVCWGGTSEARTGLKRGRRVGGRKGETRKSGASGWDERSSEARRSQDREVEESRSRGVEEGGGRSEEREKEKQEEEEKGKEQARTEDQGRRERRRKVSRKEDVGTEGTLEWCVERR
ncbi:hypothetical protein F503_08244 [Ophiostoma piceae UAMH 11346]|uniref:Uncharacterized protein n=1 Tax=Ophiostoma piceae (strain UAMH 11346) TaxID=1262450 RepID=S3CHD6_OPHP1|nr:hypothetical protein F503_08244 [Ophiostoma piceae UAMH 11346]